MAPPSQPPPETGMPRLTEAPRGSFSAPPPAATGDGGGGAPWSADQEYNSGGGRIIAEFEEIPAGDTNKSRLILFGAIAIVLFGLVITIGGAIHSWIKSTPQTTGPGLVVTAQYAKTRQRMQMIAMIAVRHYEFNSNDPTENDLVTLGVDRGMFLDAWNKKTQINAGLLRSAGMDGNFNTEDDIWCDLRNMEFGGYLPDPTSTLQNMTYLPTEARTMVNQAQQMQREAGLRQERMERAIREAEGYGMDGMPIDGGSYDSYDGYNSQNSYNSGGSNIDYSDFPRESEIESGE